MQVSLHDDGEEGLIHPPAALQQGGEERPGAQLGDPQLQVAGSAGERPRPVTIAVCCPGGRALMRAAPITALSSASIRAW